MTEMVIAMDGCLHALDIRLIAITIRGKNGFVRFTFLCGIVIEMAKGQTLRLPSLHRAMHGNTHIQQHWRLCGKGCVNVVVCVCIDSSTLFNQQPTDIIIIFTVESVNVAH